ncbi:TIGR02530 family flagellar biosynthesis protein [Cohnella lubricantis]|nr:TIGR02530 family flagellar biosynthesis protein [Cohnella lubricantis]MBP2117492.1 flagellar operon protein [Cohnella lubricantis]
MSDRMLIGQLAASRTGPILPSKRSGTASADSTANTGTADTSFKQWLDRVDLKFSQHAEQRLRQRGIQLQPEQLDRITSALNQAEAKGAKDSLVLFRDIAMIVNIPNRTVITAMDGSSMKDHVFTQIDSAVVVP